MNVTRIQRHENSTFRQRTEDPSSCGSNHQRNPLESKSTQTYGASPPSPSYTAPPCKAKQNPSEQFTGGLLTPLDLPPPSRASFLAPGPGCSTCSHTPRPSASGRRECRVRSPSDRSPTTNDNGKFRGSGLQKGLKLKTNDVLMHSTPANQIHSLGCRMRNKASTFLRQPRRRGKGDDTVGTCRAYESTLTNMGARARPQMHPQTQKHARTPCILSRRVTAWLYMTDSTQASSKTA